MEAKILLVEDDVDLGNLIRQCFEINDFQVDVVADGREAYELMDKNPGHYNLLLIEASLPGMDGFELAEKIKDMGCDTCFVLFTQCGSKGDRIRGLKIGATDCISKPIDVDELILRSYNIIRRLSTRFLFDRNVIQCGDVRLNSVSMMLYVGSRVEMRVSASESVLLNFLLSNENRLVTRREILGHFQKNSHPFSGRSMDVFIFRLRKRLEASRFVRIDSVYGRGFILSVRDR
ncbi:response regulator transcription factor [Chitinophaga arvensicola]|uniref:DNA-binding response regulator, OmpR family, contains REC and winged-helix (WHTH) domain n=1 Tax=Chitinophaga arvensicola TaxID=29529 RepID=A0A1I0RV17_9BACT|nr:response regulator transcription factor [Chitinophaga arvensicola]SEW45317.1 DNA-binding response regulator, OmpR family, contains REC and winged-helix (wHTH) domain [Chitinophaga arvensicola]